ncbi:sugar phosphate isomerase/epimerase [Thiomonas sp. FB-6]|uniref:sugar phosphate isomerase/epimerase family protein n=1 Tax=Thiomonas sp. FB-6 TaxID=1158291 RepID=UPI000377964C|nr:sugar phosphate isomerase/epimerase [Thiomonas sp. FB-6]
MTIRYSLAHLTVLGCPTPEMVYVAARAGYDYVSPRLIYMGLPSEPNYSLADNPEMMRQTRRALVETGMKVHDIELARVHDDMHPTKYLPAMEVAAELGAKAVLSSIWTSDIAYATEKFARICELAAPFGLSVDLEYVPISSVNTLQGAAAVLRAVRQPNAGLMVDMHHFHRAHDKPEDLDELPRDWFHFAHICDACADIPADRAEMTRILREERLYVGEGGIDVASILRHLPVPVYSIELPHLKRAREFGYAEHAFRCLESAKNYVQEHAQEIGCFA